MEGSEPQLHNPEIERRANPESPEELSLRAEHVIRHFLLDHPESELRKMVEEKTITIERAYKTLVQLARDPKTGAQRPDILPYVLQYEMMVARENGDPVTVGFYDLDDFKKINTELDHIGADRALQHAVEVMGRSVRDNDVVSLGDENLTRWGGEEFVIVYPGTSRADAMVPAERLRENFARELLGVRPNEQPMTLSGGLVEYDPARHASWEALLKEGSQLVQVAKAAGKNRIATELPETKVA